MMNLESEKPAAGNDTIGWDVFEGTRVDYTAVARVVNRNLIALIFVFLLIFGLLLLGFESSGINSFEDFGFKALCLTFPFFFLLVFGFLANEYPYCAAGFKAAKYAFLAYGSILFLLSKIAEQFLEGSVPIEVTFIIFGGLTCCLLLTPFFFTGVDTQKEYGLFCCATFFILCSLFALFFALLSVTTKSQFGTGIFSFLLWFSLFLLNFWIGRYFLIYKIPSVSQHAQRLGVK